MLVAGAHKGGADRTVDAPSQATSPPAWLNDGSTEAQPHPMSRHGYPAELPRAAAEATHLGW